MQTHTLNGQCHCGKVSIVITLSAEPATYTPRACDCDFCRQHDAAYLSDPLGSIAIQTEAISNLNISQQGDELAEFLSCVDCEQLMLVSWQQEQQRYGCINVQVLSDKNLFNAATPASPKQLSAEQKVSRWKKLWFPNVTFTFTK